MQLTAWIIHAKSLKELKGLSEFKPLAKGNIVALLTQLSWLHPVKSTPTAVLQQVHVLASELLDKLGLGPEVHSSGMDVRERIQAVSALARMGYVTRAFSETVVAHTVAGTSYNGLRHALVSAQCYCA
jgi:hypothetical protein